MQERQVLTLGQENPLEEEEMATCPSILAGKIPRTEESGGLWFMGLQRVGHEWACMYAWIYSYAFIFHGNGNITFRWSLKWSEVSQSCPTLCDPMDCSLSGSSVHGIFQARVLEWIAISFPRGSSWSRNWTLVSCIAGIYSQRRSLKLMLTLNCGFLNFF